MTERGVAGPQAAAPVGREEPGNGLPGPSTEQAQPVEDLEVDKDNYLWLRETLPDSELREEIASYQSEIMDLVFDEVDRRFESGEYLSVALTERGTIPLGSRHRDPTKITLYRRFPDGRAGQVVLPEALFEEAYAIHRKLNWTESILQDRREALVEAHREAIGVEQR